MPKQTNSGALTEPIFYILLCLHSPAHGYALMKNISEITNNRVRLGAGTLYGALDTLERKGWIKQIDEDVFDRKKQYYITDIGKKHFEKELIRLEELLDNAKRR